MLKYVWYICLWFRYNNYSTIHESIYYIIYVFIIININPFVLFIHFFIINTLYTFSIFHFSLLQFNSSESQIKKWSYISITTLIKYFLFSWMDTSTYLNPTYTFRKGLFESSCHLVFHPNSTHTFFQIYLALVQQLEHYTPGTRLQISINTYKYSRSLYSSLK